MSIPATESVTSGMFGSPTTSSSTGKPADKEMFLQLLVAQMRYQDPSNPTDSSQFLAQSAQFTALEKMQDVADQTAALLSAQMAFGASGLIGKQVSWADADGTTRTGTVRSVAFGAQGPMLDVDGSSCPIASVLSVKDNSGTTTTPTAP
jgi:flagellar basal-body rod modification protein FlgD